MKTFLSYTLVAVLLVALATAGFGLALDPVGRRSLMWAGVVAIPVQLLAFGAILWTRRAGEEANNAFLLAFLVGGAARVGVLGVAGLLVTQTETDLAAAPLLLGLAGYFFALLLLEGWFLHRSTRIDTTE